jgi:hypothetical protein
VTPMAGLVADLQQSCCSLRPSHPWGDLEQIAVLFDVAANYRAQNFSLLFLVKGRRLSNIAQNADLCVGEHRSLHMLPRFITRNCSGWRVQFLLRPLKELWRSNPSDVISRYSTSAIKTGSTHVAFGLRTALVLRIWLETVREVPRYSGDTKDGDFSGQQYSPGATLAPKLPESQSQRVVVVALASIAPRFPPHSHSPRDGAEG